MVVYLLKKAEPAPTIDQLIAIGNLLGVKGGWTPGGVNATYVIALLKAYGVTTGLVTGDAEMKSALQESTEHTPRIAMVQLPTADTKVLTGYRLDVGRRLDLPKSSLTATAHWCYAAARQLGSCAIGKLPLLKIGAQNKMSRFRRISESALAAASGQGVPRRALRRNTIPSPRVDSSPR